MAKTAPQEAVTDEVSLLLAIKVGLAIEEFKISKVLASISFQGPARKNTKNSSQVYLTHGVPELLAAPDTR